MRNATEDGSLVVVGQGFVGLPLAMAAANSGFRVLGVDLDEQRVAKLRSGRSITQDVDSGELQRHLKSGAYDVVADYSSVGNFDVAIIAVPTPLENGEPNLDHIVSAARSISSKVSRGCLVVLESTSYPGTTEDLVRPILESESSLVAGVDFHLGYSPERIDPGNREWTLLTTPKLVSGVCDESLARVDKLYRSFGIQTVSVRGTREAELAKLIENTFRHVNIALVNELAVFSNALGVNIWDAIDAASTKPFGFMRFEPGPGVGGHCLPVDPSFLSWAIKEKTGESFHFVELANRVNAHMPAFVVEKVRALVAEHMPETQLRRRLLLVGMAYKANTYDVRESPGVRIAQILLEQDEFEVYAYDNVVMDDDWPVNLTRVTSASSISFDVGVLITSHEDGQENELLGNCAIVFDTRNKISGARVHSF